MKLNLEERTALETECDIRQSVIVQQGYAIGGVGTRLIVEMLSRLLSVEELADAKEAWLFWLSDQLDHAEAELRRQKILA